MTQIEISFITPLFNCIEYTREFLQSLAGTAPKKPYEIILVDDLSTDGTREFLQNLADPPHRVFLNQTNQGFAKSSNLGARHAKGKYLCFLNNDLVLTPGWLDPMYELVRSRPDIGAVGNIQLEPESKLVHHAGVFFDWDGRPVHAWRYRRRRPKGDFGEWNAITAACFMIESQIFQACGGFEEAYINGFEDIDLCVRLRQKEYRLLVSHRSVIGHHASVSPGRKKYDNENRERFLKRWQDVTMRWGKEEWPAQYVHRYARKWWKMAPWRMVQAIIILAFRHIVRRRR
jgi:GT2 family glycosyltransferase